MSLVDASFPEETSAGRRKPADPQRAPARTERQAIALIDDHEFTRQCIAICLDLYCTDTIVTAFRTVADYIAAGPRPLDLIVYHSHGIGNGTEAGSRTLAALTQELEPTPFMVVSAADDFDAVLEALTAGARGYIPTVSTSLEITIEVMRLVRAGGIFAPVDASLMQKARSQPQTTAGLPRDYFTPRQIAVLEHLTRGNANKVIAHELSMSEGTVKVHVRNIMKKMKATNRTQAVFRAYSLMAGQGSAELAGASAKFTQGKAMA